MILFLSFFVSWLVGLLMILAVAFRLDSSFSMTDITSFGVFTLAACIFIMPVLYIPSLRFASKYLKGRKQYVFFPLILVLLANIPVHLIIMLSTNNLYGENEAVLFHIAFITIAAVFGLAVAMKNNLAGSPADTQS